MIITRSRFEVNGKDLVLMETYGIVYLLIDGTNDKEYVGQTTRTVEERFNEHKKSDFLIGRAIRAHGEENFVIAILKKCETSEELDHWEKHFIKSRNTMSPNGYNLTDGGERNFIMLPETRAKMSASHSGEKNYNFGVPMPAEQRAKLSAARKGKPLPPETCANASHFLLNIAQNFLYHILAKHFWLNNVQKCQNLGVEKKIQITVCQCRMSNE